MSFVNFFCVFAYLKLIANQRQYISFSSGLIIRGHVRFFKLIGNQRKFIEFTASSILEFIEIQVVKHDIQSSFETLTWSAALIVYIYAPRLLSILHALVLPPSQRKYGSGSDETVCQNLASERGALFYEAWSAPLFVCHASVMFNIPDTRGNRDNRPSEARVN